MKCVCIGYYKLPRDIGYLTHRIGYIETTGIGASVRHRPADNGVTLVNR